MWTFCIIKTSSWMFSVFSHVWTFPAGFTFGLSMCVYHYLSPVIGWNSLVILLADRLESCALIGQHDQGPDGVIKRIHI